jgi:Mn2+/Fe2+ NRAMP family transporter
MARAFGVVGSALFATTLFATCLGAALELSLALPYNVAQGFGWKWGKDHKPIEAPRFYLLVALFPIVGFAASLVGGDPSQLALLAATLMALFLPFSVVPFLVIMNDPAYLGDKTNHRFANLATFGVVLLAFVVAAVSIPLVVLSGGG